MKTYIDEIVELVKEKSGIKGNQLAKFYALLVLTKGDTITPEDVHDGWAMNMNFKERNAYCYGHDHLSLVPFDELSKECQDKDRPIAEALNKIAKEFFLKS